ncbi:actin family [Cercophora newfieldiana]|uniref:Actin family n=1 Tax=Cercophora newfieldiana TaxID=92897 RepID=A0AA40CZC2_9PEZI|nr:actin family [Cercophora newfieldiana]
MDSPISQAVLVFDNGSSKIRAGYAGEEEPRVRRHNPVYSDASSLERHPIEDGLVTDWDAFENIWRDIFDKQFDLSTSACPVVMSERPLTPKPHRRKMAELLFESFQTPAVHLASASALSMYSAGRTTAMVILSGESSTFITPHYEGFPLPHATAHLPFGGGTVTSALQAVLSSPSHPLSLSTARAIKHRCCYAPVKGYLAEVARTRYSNAPLDWPRARAESPEYTLPDGHTVSLETEAFSAPEFAMSLDTWAPTVRSSTSKCVLDIRRDLNANIILSGGGTLLPGLGDRIANDLIASETRGSWARYRVVAPAEWDLSTWIGGSVLGSLSTMEEMWVTKQDYEEVGAEVVAWRCLF